MTSVIRFLLIPLLLCGATAVVEGATSLGDEAEATAARALDDHQSGFGDGPQPDGADPSTSEVPPSPEFNGRGFTGHSALVLASEPGLPARLLRRWLRSTVLLL